jgi:protein tyrosine phosphatase
VISIIAVKCKVSSNSSQNVEELLKNLLQKLENDKDVLEQIDALKYKLRTASFEDERNKIRKIIKNEYNFTFFYSMLPENQEKNRFREILCFDHSRVKLSKENNESDYIHASWVDGYKKKDEFILTQGEMCF